MSRAQVKLGHNYLSGEAKAALREIAEGQPSLNLELGGLESETESDCSE